MSIPDDQSWPPLVTLARVHALHEASLAAKGGSPGTRDPGLVESAVGNALNAACYEAGEGDPDPLVLASYLLCSLAQNHPFVDGNKRTAWLAMDDQLRRVGVSVSATTDEAEALVLEVVARRRGPQDVAAWLTARVVAWYP
jgi:death-on-curing protein